MTVSAHDVARELRGRLPGAGAVKVQKLLYYCQGWFLAWTGKPMFGEEIAAWENGPVIAELWHAEDKNQPTPPHEPLTEEMVLVVDYVVSRFGRLSGRDLITLTHAEEPWQDAYDHGGLNAEITQDTMREYFQADDDVRDIQALASRVADKVGFQAAVLALSRPRAEPVVDDSAALREMLENLA